MTWQKRTVKCIVNISTHILAQSFNAFRELVKCWLRNKIIVGSRLIAVTETSNLAVALSNETLNNKRTKHYGFNTKFVRDMTKTYSQMDCKDKYSHLS